MNKSEFVAALAKESGAAESTVNDVIAAMAPVLASVLSQGDKLTVPGLLTVERTNRAARTGRNPRTGEEIAIPAGHSVKLSAGSALKNAVK